MFFFLIGIKNPIFSDSHVSSMGLATLPKNRVVDHKTFGSDSHKIKFFIQTLLKFNALFDKVTYN